MIKKIELIVEGDYMQTISAALQSDMKQIDVQWVEINVKEQVIIVENESDMYKVRKLLHKANYPAEWTVQVGD